MNATYRIGLDIGSTTIKAVVLSPDGSMAYSCYERHHAKIGGKIAEILQGIRNMTGNAPVRVHLTGSVGMGVAEKCGLPFVQEVVAATNYIRKSDRPVATMIDIGGEDAKVVFFKDNQATDLRMNGNCAGGTGAFIDQMAILMGVPVGKLDELASKSTRLYSIASRCGVFSKTDVQNLMAKNVCQEDIAASIFHAVAVQVIVTLAHGCEIEAPVLFCGGPLTFLSGLRAAFADYLHLKESDIILPENSHLIPAWGAALAEADAKTMTVQELADLTASSLASGFRPVQGLEPIFKDEEEYSRWKERMSRSHIRRKALQRGREEVTIGIDSGSTTTKIVVLNKEGELLYSYYHGNDGNPTATAEAGLRKFKEECDKAGTEITVTGSCSTGYGEDLIKAAFRLDDGIVETMAHYTAARSLTEDVSFILDIGGQDMKAMFVSGGVINRIEINEACSSGCGSFIAAFAESLGYAVQDFASEACKAEHPCDLGTRCTVFMNSKVKQSMRAGATVQDIAAGLSYSVVKNCLYKVLRLKNTNELGDRIVVQGGAMKNDSVVRAFEKLTGREVFRSDCPELMGAVGCAIYARKFAADAGVSLADLLDRASCTSVQRQCHGCENACLITEYKFANGNRYYSGNRCEKVFTNRGKSVKPGVNSYTKKLELLFGDDGKKFPAKAGNAAAGAASDAPAANASVKGNPIAVIGIPRCLNMFEEYPFWRTLFAECNVETVLSDPSDFGHYEEKVKLVMSDNICFPAKLVHSHIQNLVDKGVQRIFMPFVVYEKLEGGLNSYNCPVVSGYSEVVRSVQDSDVPVDSPVITFKDEKLLLNQCRKYLLGLGVEPSAISGAFRKALEAMASFEKEIAACEKEVLRKSREEGRLAVLVAGRPYHADPLIQHKLSDMVAAMGVDVITDDIVRCEDVDVPDVHFVPQWAYANRILKAAKWAAGQDENVQCMQITSFGCGPDAFLTDETRSLLKRYGKTLTLLKVDDMNNVGSLKLRVRSSIESLKWSAGKDGERAVQPFVTTPVFGMEDRRRKILAPFFTPFISPLIPPLMKLAGYDVDNLPMSDATSCEYGLQYANNEVCYPATLIVGDIIKAFKDGKYNPHDTAVGITQTGGQCRASNYISLIKKALTEAGYGEVPVISLTFSDLDNKQPGFRINWLKILPAVLNAVLYSDCIAKLYYASAVRETVKGASNALKDKYLRLAQKALERNAHQELLPMLASAAREFDAIVEDKDVPKVGIVGEIYLKFNPFAQKDVCGWLVSRGIEVVPPLLTDFFMQCFVNYSTKQDRGLQPKRIPDRLIHATYNLCWKKMQEYGKAASAFRRFTPFDNIYSEAEEASKVISLHSIFGEGWLLPGEIMSLASRGVNHVISLQPFGCIANHIVARGIEKNIKRHYPDLHLLALDFDSGISDVNVTNRLLLFIDDLRPGNVRTGFKEEAV